MSTPKTEFTYAEGEEPPEGRLLHISERSLSALLDAARQADLANVLGNCNHKPPPVYCRWCWAMEEAEKVLEDGRRLFF